MKNLLYAVLSLLIFSQVVAADDKNAARELLETKIESALAVLQRKDLVQQEKNQKIVEIVEPIFDYNLMAKLTLGRKYWPGLSEKNRIRFTDLFVERLKATYIDKLSLYTDEKVTYEPPIQEGKKIQIPTRVISKSNNIAMMYKLYKSSTGWRIYDLEIEGVSLISSYRSQFYDILSKGTIEDLLLKLQKPEKK